MAIVKDRDVVKNIMVLANEDKQIHEQIEGKFSPGELSEKEIESVCKLSRDEIKNGVRNAYTLSIDHQKMVKCDFTDTWAGKVEPQSNGTTAIRMINVRRQGNETEQDYYHTIELTPKNITGFVNLKKKYQFYHINKISVQFVSNSANNLTPIICKYVPPMKTEIRSEEIDQITKFAQSIGQKEGYMSIHSPYYLVHTMETDTQGKVTDRIKSTYPVLHNDIVMTNMDDEYKVNYGSFLFECKNLLGSNVQSFIARVSYEIDFYTGIDYDNVEVSDTPDTPGGDDDGGNTPVDPGDSNTGSGIGAGTGLGSGKSSVKSFGIKGAIDRSGRIYGK